MNWNSNIFVCLALALTICSSAFSENDADTLRHLRLREVSVVGKTGLDSINEVKPLSSIDEHLQKLSKVNLIKRGGYAWEPTVNNMTTERISVTIDGMKIFCACTDRMDPVTSYVEILNLNNIQVGSGIGGSLHASNSIGGSLDLKLQKAGFHPRKLNLTLNSAFETNGNYRILGGGLSYSSPRTYVNSGVFYRKSENYRAGGNQAVDFSQFEKLNLFTNAGYLLRNRNIIEGTLIYDVASNVGYTALTMDVKSAKGLITSLSYRDEHLSGLLSSWETKVYYNSISHVMDDTKRPNVAMHMDMPGQSRTGGYYSTLKGRLGKHLLLINQDLYYNQSKAEMTMYPTDGSNPPMFMYTWPDIRTLNAGLYGEDRFMLDIKNAVLLSSKIAVQRDGVQSDFGYHTFQIYYPDMDQFQNRLVGNLSGKYTHFWKDMNLKVGAGFGSRAPSATEAYGFYLFNSFDNYDYIGNPHLKNESSLEGNFSFTVKKPKFSATLDASYFRFFNYIIGKPAPSLSSMTLGASGVKVYRNLSGASVFNSNLETKAEFLHVFNWSNRVAFALGQDNHHHSLPLIAPLSNTSSIDYRQKNFSGGLEWQLAAKQARYSAEYGEDQTPAYSVWNASAGYVLSFDGWNATFKAGLENIFDARYSSYADWNNIPRKGRNAFLNVTFTLL